MKKLNPAVTRALVSIGILAIMLSTVGLASAQRSGKRMGQQMDQSARGAGHGGFGSGPRLERLAAHLDLSQEQLETIKSLREEARDQNMQSRKEMMRLQNEMKGEMLEDNPSEDMILSLNEKIGELKTEIQAQRLKMRLAIREQLTPEQRDQMLTMPKPGRGKERGMDRQHGRRGSGQGRNPGHGDGTGPRAGSDCPQNNK